MIFNKCGFEINLLDNGKWFLKSYKMTEEKRGGYRPGAGRPKGEETEVLSFRVPKKKAKKLKKLIEKLIADLLNQG